MKKILLLLLTILFSVNSFSQDQIWSKSSEERVALKDKLVRSSIPTEFDIYSLDMDALKSQLVLAPSQDNFTASSNVIIPFPSPDGTINHYRIYESTATVMHPDLSARYQDIKAYVGQGIEDPSASIQISTTLFGLHTMTLSGKTGTTYIDPYTKDLSEYMVYSKSNLRSTRAFSCEVAGTVDKNSNPDLTTLASDSKFRTYRLAMACTIEYAAYHVTAAGLDAGTLAQKKAAVLAAMVVSMVRINGLYQRDMSLTMQLVANNDLVIFITSDNFSNTNATALINESQTVIGTAIGDANYDIGHTVSTGGGGLAQRPCVCISGQKARGITGSPAPVGDAYDIDFVAHEIGHQFGANHTFAGDGGNCAGNRSGTTAVEPGSGTTIMAYAGICAPQDVQPNSDDHFHAVSLSEMFSHITTAGNCVVGVPNGNAVPVVPPQTSYTIPNGTPFKLTATGVTDADGDTLTYCWEQNNGFYVSSPIPDPLSTTGSNFRSYSPSLSPTRFFPKYSDVLAGNLVQTYEMLPTVARTMTFRMTARDNRTPNGGQTQYANMTLTFASGIPFKVTSQNTDGISWTQGSSQNITWDLGGTAVPATTAVNILLSTDGGITFPTVLATATANDGAQTITVPNVTGLNCRIKIEPTNNVYYSLNSKSFAIGYVCNAASATPNLAIPDGLGANTPGALASSVINVPTAGVVNNMSVTFNTNHTWIGDLVVKLSHPDGTQITLWNRTCNAPQASGINITFQDGAGTIVCGSPTTGTYSPVGLLSAFNGKPTNGNWTLTAQDFYNVDSGNIVSWGVNFGCSLGTNSVNQLSNFSVYPNPNNGNFTVQFNSNTGNDIKIGVHDMRGRQIFDKTYTNSGAFNQNIQLNNLQSGVYLVSVQDGDTKEVKRIIIE